MPATLATRRQPRLSKVDAILARGKAKHEREIQLHDLAAKTGQRVLKIGAKTVAFATYEGSECFEIYVYQIDERYPLGRSWTPGPCIASLKRCDSDTPAFLALGKLLVQD